MDLLVVVLVVVFFDDLKSCSWNNSIDAAVVILCVSTDRKNNEICGESLHTTLYVDERGGMFAMRGGRKKRGGQASSEIV